MAKNKRKRECPVLQGPIDPATCGTKRGPDFGCPQSCPHNPWSPQNYPQVAELEAKLMSRLQRALVERIGLDRAEQLVIRAGPGDSHDTRFHALVVAELHGAEPGTSSFFDTWVESNAANLKNDERVFLRGLATLRPTVLEFRQVLDDRTVEAVDLLDPEGGTLRLVDFSAASFARRFQTTFGYIFDLPFYTRNSGNRLTVPEIGDREPTEVIRVIARHLGWDESRQAFQQWLILHGEKVFASLEAVESERRRRRFERSNLNWVEKDYLIAGGAKAAKRVLAIARRQDWLDEIEPPSPDEGTISFEVLGPLPAGEITRSDDPLAMKSRNGIGQLVIDTSDSGVAIIGLDSPELADATEQLEKLFEGLLTDPRRKSRRLGSDSAARGNVTPIFDPNLVPEDLLEGTSTFEIGTRRFTVPEPLSGPQSGDPVENQRRIEARLWQEHRNELPDQPIPALGGLTPRQAAAIPEMRPALTRLLKSHVRSTDDLRYRRRLDVDMNPVLEELGFHDLVFPAPPLPAVAEEDRVADDEEDEDDEDWDDEFDEEDSERDADRSARFLPMEAALRHYLSDGFASVSEAGLERPKSHAPLTEKVFMKRYKLLMGRESILDLIGTVDAAWPGLVEYLIELTLDDVPGPPGHAHVAAIQLTGIISSQLLFDGHYPDEDTIDYDRLGHLYRVHASILSRIFLRAHAEGRVHELLERLIEESPEPRLAEFAVNHVLSALERGLEIAEAPHPAVPACALAAAMAVIWEFAFIPQSK